MPLVDSHGVDGWLVDSAGNQLLGKKHRSDRRMLGMAVVVVTLAVSMVDVRGASGGRSGVAWSEGRSHEIPKTIPIHHEIITCIRLQYRLKLRSGSTVGATTFASVYSSIELRPIVLMPQMLTMRRAGPCLGRGDRASSFTESSQHHSNYPNYYLYSTTA